MELKYPRGWKFGRIDSIVDMEKMQYVLDRDLYLTSGGIDRFIRGMREGFSIDDILDGKYDGIVDNDPRNRLGVHVSGGIIVDNPEIEINDTCKTLQELADKIWVTLRTAQRKLKEWVIIRVDWLYYLQSE